MATILSQSRVCDGFDCRCELLANGETIFHGTKPLRFKGLLRLGD